MEDRCSLASLVLQHGHNCVAGCQEQYQSKRGVLECGFRTDQDEDDCREQIGKPDPQISEGRAPSFVKLHTFRFVRFVLVGICGGQRKEPERDCPERLKIEVDRKIVDFDCQGKLLHKATEEKAQSKQKGSLREELALLRSPNDGQDAREKREVDYAHIRMEKHWEKPDRRINDQGSNNKMVQQAADGKDGYEDFHEDSSRAQFLDLAHIADERAAAGIRVQQIKDVANRRRFQLYAEPILVVRPKEIAEEIQYARDREPYPWPAFFPGMDFQANPI